MKEVQRPLRIAYLAALSGLTIDSTAVPVYDEFAPDNAPDHYIIMKVGRETIPAMFQTTLVIMLRFRNLRKCEHLFLVS